MTIYSQGNSCWLDTGRTTPNSVRYALLCSIQMHLSQWKGELHRPTTYILEHEATPEAPGLPSNIFDSRIFLDSIADIYVCMLCTIYNIYQKYKYTHDIHEIFTIYLFTRRNFVLYEELFKKSSANDIDRLTYFTNN